MSEIKDFPKLYPRDIQLIISKLIEDVYPDYTIPVNIEEIVEALGLEIVPEPGLKKITALMRVSRVILRQFW